MPAPLRGVRGSKGYPGPRRELPGGFRLFTQTRRSPGVLLVRQDLPVGEAIETLLLIWQASEAGEWVNRLCLVPGLGTIAVGGSVQAMTRAGALLPTMGRLPF